MTVAWHEEAKKLYGPPHKWSVGAIARHFGRDAITVAFAVDHNGAREKHRLNVKRQRERRRIAQNQNVPVA